MTEYECDGCGACCRGYLIVEIDLLDLLREPRLAAADSNFRGKQPSEVCDMYEEGKAVLLAAGLERPCPFLSQDCRCSIYPTRPNSCVAMLAGDSQCQYARSAAGLPPLLPVVAADPR